MNVHVILHKIHKMAANFFANAAVATDFLTSWNEWRENEESVKLWSSCTCPGTSGVLGLAVGIFFPFFFLRHVERTSMSWFFLLFCHSCAQLWIQLSFDLPLSAKIRKEKKAITCTRLFKMFWLTMPNLSTLPLHLSRTTYRSGLEKQYSYCSGNGLFF